MTAPNASHRAEGRVERIGHHDVTISHGPVPSLQWGSMTMDFNAPKEGLPQGLKAGDPVTFEFVPSPQGSTFDITKIERKGGKP
jgi:Cu(I)/Ag(I) efflux system membrane fusion protein